MDKPRHRLSLQDMLAGVGCIATVAGALRFVTTPQRTNICSGYAASLWFQALSWLVFIPGGIGAAFGCFSLGWRDAWRPAAIGIGLVMGIFLVLLVVGQAVAISG